MKVKKVQILFRKLSSKKKAIVLARFFKTGPGEYGAGDFFLGITVPKLRKFAKQYVNFLGLKTAVALLKSKFHEERLLALIILVLKYEKSLRDREKIFHLYLKHTDYINNWDLVDLSAPNIVGSYLENDKKRKVLYRLAKSKSIWERRIAVLSTFYFIRRKRYQDTLKIAKLLLHDKHDLIHKAVGWMLREVGKRNLLAEEQFLNKYYQKMPRTMLRYAIERFSTRKKIFYMKKNSSRYIS